MKQIPSWVWMAGGAALVWWLYRDKIQAFLATRLNPASNQNIAYQSANVLVPDQTNTRTGVPAQRTVGTFIYDLLNPSKA